MTYTINAITRIVADLDETMKALYCQDSAELGNLQSQLFDDVFADGAVLATLPDKRDPAGMYRCTVSTRHTRVKTLGICREQCSVKTLSFRQFNSLDVPRQYRIVDYCTIRSGAKAASGDDGQSVNASTSSANHNNRLGIQLMYSTEINMVPRATSSPHYHPHKSDRFVQSQLLPCGFIVYPTSKPRDLEVIFSWSIYEPRGVSRGYKKAVLSRVSSVSRLENIFLANRIASSGFIKSKNWVL